MSTQHQTDLAELHQVNKDTLDALVDAHKAAEKGMVHHSVVGKIDLAIAKARHALDLSHRKHEAAQSAGKEGAETETGKDGEQQPATDQGQQTETVQG